MRDNERVHRRRRASARIVASSAAATVSCRSSSIARPPGCRRDRPLTAVVAPPGAGKSVVLASWVRERCPAAAWVACEELDSDPVCSGDCRSALRAAQGDRWLDVVELLGEPEPDLEVVVDTVLRGLADEPAVLVLDDVHVARDAGPLRLAVGGTPAGRLAHRDRQPGRPAVSRSIGCAPTAAASTSARPNFGSRPTKSTGWSSALGRQPLARGDESARRSHRRMGGGRADGGDRAPERARSGSIPRGVLGQRPNRERLPRRGGVGAPVGGRAAIPVAHLGARRARTRRVRSGHRQRRRRDHPPAARHVGVVRGPDRRRHVPLPPAVSRHAALPTAGDQPRRRRSTPIGARRSGTRARDARVRAVAPRWRPGRSTAPTSCCRPNSRPVFMRGGATAVRALVTAMSESDPTLDAGRMVTIGSALVIAGALTSGDAWLERAHRQSADLDDDGRRRLTVARGHLAAERGDAGFGTRAARRRRPTSVG